MTDAGDIGPCPAEIDTFTALLRELERLRVRAARGRGKARLSLQDIAVASGVPKSTLANYLSGSTLIPADQLDAVVLALGATPAEAKAWAAAWERAMDRQLVELGIVDLDGRPAADELPAAAPEPAPQPEQAAVGLAPTPPADGSNGSGGPAELLADGPAQPAPRRRLGFRLILALAVAGLALAGALGWAGANAMRPDPAPPATAATAPRPNPEACRGQGCDHRDPKTAGCTADAQTPTTSPHPAMVVYLRYSPSCQAAWGRITDAQPGNKLAVFTSGGPSATSTIRYGRDVYSPMVGVVGGVEVWACGASEKVSICTTKWRPPAAGGTGAPSATTP